VEFVGGMEVVVLIIYLNGRKGKEEEEDILVNVKENVEIKVFLLRRNIYLFLKKGISVSVSVCVNNLNQRIVPDRMCKKQKRPRPKIKICPTIICTSK